MPERTITASPTVSTATAAAPRRAWVEPVMVYLRSSVCSLLATVVDMAVVELAVRVFAMGPAAAKVPAMILGGVTQFWASRHFAFRATGGSVGRQLPWYIAVQLAAAGLTVLLFHVLVRWVGMPLEPANLIAGGVVTNAFSYPLMRWVFAVRPAENKPAPVLVPEPALVPALVPALATVPVLAESAAPSVVPAR